MLTGRKRDSSGNRGPGLPPAGGWHTDLAREVRTRGIRDMQPAGNRRHGRQPEANCVGPGSRDVYRVLHPLARGRPADVVASAGIGTDFKVNSVSSVAGRGSGVRWNVICNALPSRVVVLRLNGSGDCCGSTSVGSLNDGINGSGRGLTRLRGRPAGVDGGYCEIVFHAICQAAVCVGRCRNPGGNGARAFAAAGCGPIDIVCCRAAACGPAQGDLGIARGRGKTRRSGGSGGHRGRANLG